MALQGAEALIAAELDDLERLLSAGQPMAADRWPAARAKAVAVERLAHDHGFDALEATALLLQRHVERLAEDRWDPASVGDYVRALRLLASRGGLSSCRCCAEVLGQITTELLVKYSL